MLKRGRRGRLLVMTAVLVLGGLVLAGSGSSTSAICGATITEDLVLTEDVACTGFGITVAANDVTIDFDGHSLSGDGTGFGVWILGQVFRTQILDGQIRGFRTGIQDEGPDATVSHMNVTGNRRGVFGFEYGNGYIGTGLRISDSSISHNEENGVLLFFARPFTAERSIFSNNGFDGISASGSNDGGRYIDNRFMNNGRYGLFIRDSTSYVASNTASGNGAAGIYMSEQVPSLFPSYYVAENVADRNGGLGIEIVPNGFDPSLGLPRDGGGNAAKHNGDERQCTNIVCSSNRGQAASSAETAIGIRDS